MGICIYIYIYIAIGHIIPYLFLGLHPSEPLPFFCANALWSPREIDAKDHGDCQHLQVGIELPSRSLTQPLKSYLPSRKVVFQPSCLRGYDSFREGKRMEICFYQLAPSGQGSERNETKNTLGPQSRCFFL